MDEYNYYFNEFIIILTSGLKKILGFPDYFDPEYNPDFLEPYY